MRWWVVGLALLAAACARSRGPQANVQVPAAADAPVSSAFDLQRELPLAQEIRTGTLDNGLRWFVRPNGSPPGRVELRLAVDVGSVVESDVQRGYAHIVEHMAFNGTASYPGTSLIGWLEAQGIPFGVHVNARTGFDETVYSLQVPTDDPAVVDEAIAVLAEIAGKVTFDEEQARMERGVLIEEWRTGQGVSAQMVDTMLEALFEGSPYAVRAPIGTEASLRSYTAAGLRAFYEDWYRPELMGLVVVGDVDAARVRKTIETTFGTLDNPPGARARPRPVLADRAEPIAAVVARPDAPATTVSITSRIFDVESSTLGDYRQWLVGLTVQDAVEDRLRILNRDPNGAVVRTSLGSGRITPQYSAWSASVVAPSPDKVLPALEALSVEINRVRTHGIQESELVRAVRQMQTYNRQVAARAAGGETPSGELAEELVRHYLTDEPAPDFEEMARLAIELLDEVTVEEANRWLDAHLLPEANRAIQVVVAADEGPSEADVLAAYERGMQAEVPQLYDVNVDRPLVAEPPEPGRVAAEETVPGTDAIRWTLANGATVVFLRHTTMPERVVLFAESPGGAGLADPVAGVLTLPAARLSGLGDHSPVILAKILSGRDVELAPHLRPMSEGLTGEAGVHELTALFQMTWLRLSSSRFEEDGLERARRYVLQALDGQRTVPDSIVQRVALQKYWADHPTFQIPSVEALQAVTVGQTRSILDERYRSVHDWSFVVVGDVTADQVRPLVERWIGSLHGQPGPDEAIDADIGHPEGAVTERLVMPDIDRGWVVVRLHHPLPDGDPTRRAQLSALAGVLSVRLRESLREKLGGTYVPMVEGSYESRPDPRWVTSVWFACDPARVDELRAAVSAELAKLRATGPTADEVQTQRTLLARGHETERRSLWFWGLNLLESETGGPPAASLIDVESHLSGITPQALRELGKVHLDEGSRVEVLLTTVEAP